MQQQGTEPANQTAVLDTGLACLAMLARFHNVAVSPEQLSHEYVEDEQLFAKAEILMAARQLDLKAKAVRTTFERLDRTPLPAIACANDGSFLSLPVLIKTTS